MAKILFPTDFSAAAKNAFVYALQMADSIKAEVVTLHVYELPVLHVGGLPNTLKEVYDTIELENFDNFKDQIPLLRNIAEEHQLGHIQISNILKHGDLVWAIREVVKSENIDYVIMGTKGATGLKETFLGSNTGSVITETDAYVIAVPDKAQFKKIESITFTTRYREKDKKALKIVVNLAKKLHAKVHCVYVKTKKSDVKEEIIQEWKNDFKKDNVHFYVIESNHVKDAILEFIEAYDSNMLAMLNYKRGFFQELFNQSLTQKLSYHSTVPILAIHEGSL